MAHVLNSNASALIAFYTIGEPILMRSDTSSVETTYPPQPSWMPWLVVFSAALFFFYEFIQMNMFNAISAELMRTFHLNAQHLGNLSATYLLADVLLLFPSGLILDRFSTKKVILIGMVFAVGGAFLFGAAPYFWVAALAHFMAGLSNAFCFLSCLVLASRWFPPKRMALVVGLIVTMAMAGGMVAQTPLTLLVAKLHNWRTAMFLNGFLGLAIFALVILFVKDTPKNPKDNYGALPDSSTPFTDSLRYAFGHIHVWLYGIYTSLLNLPIMVLGALWITLYLTQVYHFTALQASYAADALYLGTVVGSPIVGWLSDSLGRRKFPMLLGTLLSLATTLILMYVKGLNLLSVISLFFLLGLFSSTQIIAYPAINECVEKRYTAASLGLASLLIMGGAGIAQPFFGWLMDLGWDGTIVNGVHIYAHADFMRALALMPIAFLVSLVAITFAKETHCQHLHSH